MTSWVLALALVAMPVTDDEIRLVLESSAEAPPRSALTVWRFNGTEAKGIWLSDVQAKRVAGELQGCREADATMVPGKVPWYFWLASGLIAGGAAAYVVRR